MKPSVAGVCGTVRITKSARGRSVSSASGGCSSARRRAAARGAVRRRRSRACRTPRRAAPSRRRCRRRPRSARWPRAGARRRCRRRLLPLAAQLLREVVVQPAREGEHEGHDVRADVIVVDLAEVGDDDRMRDQLRVVVAGGRRGLRRLEPAEPPGLAAEARAGSCRTRPRPGRWRAPACASSSATTTAARAPRRRGAPPIRGSSRSAAAASGGWSWPHTIPPEPDLETGRPGRYDREEMASRIGVLGWATGVASVTLGAMGLRRRALPLVPRSPHHAGAAPGL